jgi:hypothetical protein
MIANLAKGPIAFSPGCWYNSCTIENVGIWLYKQALCVANWPQMEHQLLTHPVLAENAHPFEINCMQARPGACAEL